MYFSICTLYINQIFKTQKLPPLSHLLYPYSQIRRWRALKLLCLEASKSKKVPFILVIIPSPPLCLSAQVPRLEATSTEVRGLGVSWPIWWDFDNSPDHWPLETTNRIHTEQRTAGFFFFSSLLFIPKSTILQQGQGQAATQGWDPLVWPFGIHHPSMPHSRLHIISLLITAANVFFPQMIPLYSSQHLGNILDCTQIWIGVFILLAEYTCSPNSVCWAAVDDYKLRSGWGVVNPGGSALARRIQDFQIQ